MHDGRGGAGGVVAGRLALEPLARACLALTATGTVIAARTRTLQCSPSGPPGNMIVRMLLIRRFTHRYLWHHRIPPLERKVEGARLSVDDAGLPITAIFISIDVSREVVIVKPNVPATEGPE